MENFIKYFEPMYDLLFEEYPYLIPIVLGGSMILEALFFLILGIVNKVKNGKFFFNYEKFFIVSTSTLLGCVLLYALVCFVFAFIYQTQTLDWHFWTLYFGYVTETNWVLIILYILNGLCAIGFGIYFWKEHDSIFMAILGVLLGALGGAVVCGLLFLVFFVLYVLVAFLIYVVICLGIGFACLGVSIAYFFKMNWIVATVIMVLPGLMVGLVVALKNYLSNVKESLSSSLHGNR